MLDQQLKGMSQSIRNHPKWSRLVELVRELAFIDGGSDDAFTLASGRNSRWFFDTKPVMMHPEASHIIGELLNLRMDEMGADFVGGLELGAVPLTAIAVSTSPKHSPSRVHGKKRAQGRGGRKTNNPPGIEGTSLSQGGKVVIVEDVTTTGGSAIKAVERIHQDTNCEVIAVISIVDRQEGAGAAFSAAGIKFESLMNRSDVTNSE